MQTSQTITQIKGPNEDIIYEVEKIDSLKQQGLLSEEFQYMKTRLLLNM
jgi:hypothetical protein